jgi:hypothetical protein
LLSARPTGWPSSFPTARGRRAVATDMRGFRDLPGRVIADP